jgi:competence ComEA-like helix-hairpin-helix protein
MSHFFDFSPPQLRIIVFLAALLMILSLFYFIRSYSDVTDESLSFSVQLADRDQTYAPVIIVDLNLSPADSLELLPHIGPALASRIVAYRDSARFEKPEDIIKVKGIGYKTYEKIKSYLKVEPW